LYTTDGGNTWHEKKIAKGQFTAFAKKDNYAVACVNHEVNGGDNGTIYISGDKGITWKQASRVLEHFFVRNLFLDAAGNIYLIGSQNGNSQWVVLKSSSGQNWSEIGKVDPWLTGSPVMAGDVIYYISKQGKFSSVKSFSISTGEIERIE
jgi:hypothetical protein